MSRKTCSLKVSCKARTSSVAVGAVLLTWTDLDVECFKSGQVEKNIWNILNILVGAVLLTWADVDVECFKSGQVEIKYLEYLEYLGGSRAPHLGRSCCGVF